MLNEGSAVERPSAETTGATRWPVPILPLMLTNALCIAAMMGFVAVIGPVARALGLAEWHAGLTVTLAGVVWMALSRPWGRASDIYGRKPILLAGLGGFSVAYFALAVFLNQALAAPPAIYVSVALLILTRGFIGAFYAAVPPASAALIADRIAPERRAGYMARLGAANGVGMVLGPAGAALLVDLGLVAPLYAFAILPALGLVLILITIPSVPRRVAVPDVSLRLLDPRLRLPMTAALAAGSSVVVAQLCIGFLMLDRLGLGLEEAARMASYVLAGVGISLIAVQVVMTQIEDVSPARWLATGALIAGAGFLATGFAGSAATIIAAMCVAAAGVGLMFPSFQALAANSVSANEQGAAAGTVSAAQGLAMVLAPVMATILYGFAPAIPFVLAGGALLGTALLAIRLVSR